MRIDVIAGITAGVFVMFATLVSAAVTLGAHGVTDILLNGVAAPPILLLMLLLSRSSVVGDHRGGWLSGTLVAIATLLMTALPVWYLLA